MKKLFVVISAFLLLVSCVGKFRAKSVVEDFLSEHLVEGHDYSKSFGMMDSTSRISEQTIMLMHKQAAKLAQFKNDVKYGAPTPTLMYIKVGLKENEKDLNLTFYLNKELTQVVAFKEN